MRTVHDHEYPPSDWSKNDFQNAFKEIDNPHPFPTYNDLGNGEEYWSGETKQDYIRTIVERAEQIKDIEPPALPASTYLDFERTGDRSKYEKELQDLRYGLSTFAIAESIKQDGSYIDQVLDYAWHLCEQSTWVLPAHLEDDNSVDGLPIVVPNSDQTVALNSARVAHQLAELDYLMNDKLHGALRERIRREVDARIFQPYEARDDFEWHFPPTGNWNAVCNSTVGSAALYLIDDIERRSEIVSKAVKSLQHYLSDFDEDGCTVEGIQIWNFGFGHYTMFAALLESWTGGKLSLLEPPVIKRIAQFPTRLELSPGKFLTFNEGSEDAGIDSYAASWLGQRLNLPYLKRRGDYEFSKGAPVDDLRRVLRRLTWCSDPRTSDPVFDPPETMYYSGHQWWIVRKSEPADLVLAAKGGHNGEAHNHNDCGSFVLHYQGESLLTDLGRPKFEKEFFSENRYEHIAARSLGHSVPYVNGFEQNVGSEYEASVIDRIRRNDLERFILDLTRCYPEDANIESLTRSFTLKREIDQGPSIVISDEVTFNEETENDFSTMLVSYFPMVRENGQLTVNGENSTLEVSVDQSTEIAIERIENAMNLSHHESTEDNYKDVWRTAVRPGRGDVGKECKLTMYIRPT